MSNIKSKINVSGPFSGIVLIFVVLTGWSFFMVIILEPPIQYVFVATSILIIIVGMYVTKSGTEVFKGTKGFTNTTNIEETKITTDEIKKGEEEAHRMEKEDDN